MYTPIGGDAETLLRALFPRLISDPTAFKVRACSQLLHDVAALQRTGRHVPRAPRAGIDVQGDSRARVRIVDGSVVKALDDGADRRVQGP